MSRITRSAALPDDELEARIRATLHRHADEIEPTQPPWTELVAQAGAVVLPLHGTELPPAHLRDRRGPRFDGPWLRPTMAAAVALLIAMSAAIIVQGRGDGGGAPADGGDEAGNQEIAATEVPDSPPIPVPGDSAFLPGTATSFSLALQQDAPFAGADPTELGRSYLMSQGIIESDFFPDVGMAGAPMIAETPSGPVEWTTVWWSLYDAPTAGYRITNGAVYLRRTDQGLWTVVGSYTQGGTVSLINVRRADGVVSFTVMDNLDGSALEVHVGGRVAEDELYDGDDSHDIVIEDPAPDEVIMLELRSLLEGTPVSITSMALLPAGEELTTFAPPPETSPTTVSVPVSR